MTGDEQLPISGPFVIIPNHVSYLVASAIAAALSFRRFKQLYWAGDISLLFSNPVSRTISRALRIFPVDANRPAATVAAAKWGIAGRGCAGLVWFPEGWRSSDGTLQRFMPGIGELLGESGAPAVPAYIDGAFEAWPRTHAVPRLTLISVTFGDSVTAEALHAGEFGQHDEERIANALHRSGLPRSAIRLAPPEGRRP